MNTSLSTTLLIAGFLSLHGTLAQERAKPPASTAAATQTAQTKPPAQSAPRPAARASAPAPGSLPGNGLAQHSFLYAGQWDTRNPIETMFLVRNGKIVWTHTIPDKDEQGQTSEWSDVHLLSNGNTVICNWGGSIRKEDWDKVVQIIEVTPEKKVVWALHQWSNPDLGPASCIQLLDEPGVAENGDLQR